MASTSKDEEEALTRETLSHPVLSPSLSPLASPHPYHIHNKQTVEDKTFGLKNKNKSSKVQRWKTFFVVVSIFFPPIRRRRSDVSLFFFFFFSTSTSSSSFSSFPSTTLRNQINSYVQQLQKSAQTGPKTGPTPEEVRKQKKKLEEEQQRELASLFAVAIKQPKLQPGVDPKSVVCEFYRAGQCTKGFKCKYSHDLAVERKTQKIDLFSDMRGGEEEEGMEDWDQGPRWFLSSFFSRCFFFVRSCSSPLHRRSRWSSPLQNSPKKNYGNDLEKLNKN